VLLHGHNQQEIFNFQVKNQAIDVKCESKKNHPALRPPLLSKVEEQKKNLAAAGGAGK